jgi:O-antigen ligase/tetratricopeptide (TPR) repeat protein
MSVRFTRWIDRIQFFGLLAAVVLIPLVFNTDNQNIVLLKPILAQSIAVFLFSLWLIDALERGSFKVVPTTLNYLIVAYLLWLLFTVVINPSFLYFSLEEINRYMSVFLFFFLAQKTIRSHTRLKWSLWILFAVSLVATGYGLLQYNGIQLIEWGRSVLVSTFGNKNFFAGFLVLTTPLVIGYAFATRKLPIRILLVGLGLVQFFVIITTQTRTGFLAILVSGVLFLGLAVRFVWWNRSDNRKLHLALGLVLLLLIAVVFYMYLPENLTERLGTAFDLQKGTGRVRWIMWTGSTRAALDKPLAGFSHGSFQLSFPYYRPTFYHRFRVSHNTRHSHNEFLEVLMETGIVGLSLFLMIFVVLGAVTYRFLKRNNSWFYQWLVIGLISSIAGALAQNFASVNLRWMSSTFVFWYLVALLPVAFRLACGADTQIDEVLAKSRSIKTSNRLLPSWSWKTVIHGLIGVVLAGVGYGFYNLIKGDLSLKRTNAMIRAAEQGRISWRRARAQGQRAVGYNPYNLSALYKLGYINLKIPDQAAAMDNYDHLTDLAPNYAQIHNNIALIHNNFDRPYRSLLHFEWATTLEDNFRNHLNLMRRYTQQNFTNRSLQHALSLTRIFQEDQRDRAHRGTVKLSNRNFSGLNNTIGEQKIFESQEKKLLSGLSFLSRKFPQSRIAMSDYAGSLRFTINPTGRRTMRRIFSINKSPDRMVSPLRFLALTTRLKGQSGNRDRAIRQQYLKVLTEWLQQHPDSDPLYRLAAADLYHQMGETQTARKAIQGYASEWKKTPFYRNIIQRIQSNSE